MFVQGGIKVKGVQNHKVELRCFSIEKKGNVSDAEVPEAGQAYTVIG